MRTKEKAPSRMGSTTWIARREVLGLGERLGQQFGDDVAVVGDGAGQHADLLGQVGGVGEVAVVPEARSRRGPTGR